MIGGAFQFFWDYDGLRTQFATQTAELNLPGKLRTAGGDFDSDGDTDYAVGNLGRNTKYHASSAKSANYLAN